MKIDSIGVHEKSAAEYDHQVREYKWFGHEVLFGMCFEYVRPGERLLDIGIGTGLSSSSFARSGLEVFGIDGSREMLNICKSKEIAKDLRLFDVSRAPLPYPERAFDHVISCGVFHFFGDLSAMFREVSRIIKRGGIFAFTIWAQPPQSEKAPSRGDDYSELQCEATSVFLHKREYIGALLQACGFGILKELGLLARSGRKGDAALFRVYVVQEIGI